MPALALVSLIPLVLSLLLGTPGMLRTSESAPSSTPAVSAELTAPAAETDQDEPEEASPAPLLDLQVSGLEVIPIALDAAPAVLKPAPKPVPAPTPPRAAQPMVSTPFTPILSLLHPPRFVTRQGGPPPMTAEDIVTAAEGLLGVPYVWGGTSDRGLDCSAFVSRVWGVGRRTTETLPGVAFRIDKEELLPGDILNLTIGQDPRGYGHVRMFAGWANAEHTRMWDYEETPPRSIHRVIAYDNRYTPLRRVNYSPGNLAASHLLNMLFGRQEASLAAPASVDSSVAVDDDDDDDSPGEEIATASVPRPPAHEVVEQRVAPITAFAAFTAPDQGHGWIWPGRVSWASVWASPSQSATPVSTHVSASPTPHATAIPDSGWTRVYASPVAVETPQEREWRPAATPTPIATRRIITTRAITAESSEVAESSSSSQTRTWRRAAAAAASVAPSDAPNVSTRPAAVARQPAPSSEPADAASPQRTEQRHEQASEQPRREQAAEQREQSSGERRSASPQQYQQAQAQPRQPEQQKQATSSGHRRGARS